MHSRQAFCHRASHQAPLLNSIEVVKHHLARHVALTSFHSSINCVDLLHFLKLPVVILCSHPKCFVSYSHNYGISKSVKPAVVAHQCVEPGIRQVTGDKEPQGRSECVCSMFYGFLSQLLLAMYTHWLCS